MECKITDFTVYLQTKEWTTILETWLHWRYMGYKEIEGLSAEAVITLSGHTLRNNIYYFYQHKSLYQLNPTGVLFYIYKATTPFVSEI